MGGDELFFRLKKAVLVMRFAWCSNERLLSKIPPRFWICGEEKRVELSMLG